MKKKFIEKLGHFRQSNTWLSCIAVGFVLFQLFACQKDKLDVISDYRPTTSTQRNSNVRLVNLGNYNQLIAGKDSITNFVANNTNLDGWYKYPGTRFFPETGRLGKIWAVPQEIFDSNEQIDFKAIYKSFQPTFDTEISFSTINSYQTPMDYYLLPTWLVKELPNYFAVKRGVTAPSKPDYFKIRVINLTGEMTMNTGNFAGKLENLQGPVSLAYANGDLVNDKTNNIDLTNRVSEYIELPYGTYQFKVLTADGRQIPGTSNSSDEISLKNLDPATSTMATKLFESTNLVFAPVQYYAPGGVYTIVVSPRQFNIYTSESGDGTEIQQNGFDIITDVEPIANLSYTRVQSVNAFTNTSISLKVNSKSLAGALGFGEVSEYSSLAMGNNEIEALDANGKVLVKTSYDLRPGQNYTIWLYPNEKNEAKILVVHNDLSGSYSRSTATGFTQSAVDDATYSRGITRFPIYKRYLNLSPDNNNITYTHNNGQYQSNGLLNAPDANLIPGVPVFQFPYLATRFNSPAYELMVYRSGPDKIPGSWASDIPIASNEGFVASKNLYEKVKRKIPVHEAGYYTIALIGKSSANAAKELKARILIVKHIK